MGIYDNQIRRNRERVEQLFEKVQEARSKLLANVAVFVVSDDEHNRNLVKMAWAEYDRLNSEYHDAARVL